MFIFIYRCGKPPGEPEHRQSIPTSTHGSVGGGQPQTIMSKDGVQYQQGNDHLSVSEWVDSVNIDYC